MGERPHRLIYRDVRESGLWARKAYTQREHRDECARLLRRLGMEVETWDVLRLPVETSSREAAAAG